MSETIDHPASSCMALFKNTGVVRSYVRFCGGSVKPIGTLKQEHRPTQVKPFYADDHPCKAKARFRYTPEQKAEAEKLIKEGVSFRQIEERVGVSYNRAWKWAQIMKGKQV